jgi:hypothetical protein
VGATGSRVLDWLAAVGTMLAAIVAVWVGVLRVRLVRPRLSIDDPGGVEVVTHYGESAHTYRRTRLLVTNRGKSVAEDVEILLSARRVGPRSADDGSTWDLESAPLTWDLGREYPKKDSPTITIPPGATRPILLLETNPNLGFASTWEP